MTRRKKRLQKEIEGIQRQIHIHLKKLKEDLNSNSFDLKHHKRELDNFQDQLIEKYRKLKRKRKVKGDAEK